MPDDWICCRPAELQFYTSVASIAVQIPASIFVMDWSVSRNISGYLWKLYCNFCSMPVKIYRRANWLLHCSLTAVVFICRVLLRMLSWDTYLLSLTGWSMCTYVDDHIGCMFSVANTAKRAILIWLSVLIFANHVTLLRYLLAMIQWVFISHLVQLVP